MRVADVVRRHASARPEDAALACGSERISWRELDRRTDALAASFAALADPGGRVAIVTSACHRHWETIFAASKAALVSVPLNQRWTVDELVATLDEVDPSLAVVDLGLRRTASDLVDAVAVDALAPVPVIGFRGVHDHATDYETLVRQHGDVRPLERPAWPYNVIGFTSGTTGRPRGAVLSQEHAISSALWLAGLLGLSAGDRILACMPSYVYRGGSGGLAPMMVGACSVMCDFDVDRVLTLIEQEAITHLILAPVMVERILASPRAMSASTGSLRGVWLGGAPAAPETITALQDLVGDIVGSLYGGTEATAVASMRWGLGDDGHLRSIGRASPLNDVRLVSDDGSDAESGRPGEIWVRGMTVMSGYWPAVEGDGLSDGWYATGDVAVRDPDGYLYLVDRRADVINTGGLNVYSIEVEQLLAGHPDVAECAVVSSPDSEFGEAVTAIVVGRSGVDVDVGGLADHCRRGLAGYKCPRMWVVRASLPRNSMGKVDKRALRDELWRGHGSSIGG